MATLNDFRDPETGVFRDAETGDAYPAEEMMVDAIRNGRFHQFGAVLPDPNQPAAERPTIRAEFLRYLALGGCPECRPDPRALEVSGVWVKGEVSLFESRIDIPIYFENCRFEDRVTLLRAHARTLHFNNCRLEQGMLAEGLEVEGTFFFWRGSSSGGALQMSEARIEGAAHFTGAVIETEAQASLLMENAAIGGHLALNGAFETNKSVSLYGARIEKDVLCGGARFLVTDAVALSLRAATIGGRLFLGDGFWAKRGVVFSEARIGQSVLAQDARFETEGFAALVGRNAEVGRDVNIAGARLDGGVDLAGARLGGDLTCTRAQIDGGGGASVSLSFAQIGGGVHIDQGFRAKGEVAFGNASIGTVLFAVGGRIETERGEALHGISAHIGGDVILAGGFEAIGPAYFSEATIDGLFECSGGVFRGRDGVAITLMGARIGSSVVLNQGFRAEGVVSLDRSEIRGGLDAGGGAFINPGRFALSLQDAQVALNVSLAAGFAIEGAAYLQRARIGGAFDARGGRFEAPGLVALDFSNAHVSQGFVCTGECTISGAVIGSGATIDGVLGFTDVKIDHPDGEALDLSGVKTSGDVILGVDFEAAGGVSLLSARIGGSLGCDGARIRRPGALALQLSGAAVERYVFLRDGFHAIGQVQAIGLRVSGAFEASDGLFESEVFPALSIDNATIGGALMLRGGFRAKGGAQVRGCRIEGYVDTVGGAFEAVESNALSFQSTTIAGDLVLRHERSDDSLAADPPRRTEIKGTLDLTQCACGALNDERDVWPPAGRLRLDGFVYKRISGRAASLRYQDRADWLLRQHPDDLATDFKPQPFEQLMQVMTETGHRHEARKIGVLMERRRRRADAVRPRWFAQSLHRLFGAFAGYGYRTDFALYWAVGFVALASLLFDLSWREGVMTPPIEAIESDAVWTGCARDAANPAVCWTAEPAGRDYTPFDPALYALDVFVPIIDLGQEVAWRPSAARGWRFGERFGFAEAAAAARVQTPILGEWLYKISRTRIGAVAWAWSVAHEILGYLLSAFAIAGAARLVRQER